MPNEGLFARFSSDVPQLLSMAHAGIQVVNDRIQMIRILVPEAGDAMGARVSASGQSGPHWRGNGRLTA